MKVHQKIFAAVAAAVVAGSFAVASAPTASANGPNPDCQIESGGIDYYWHTADPYKTYEAGRIIAFCNKSRGVWATPEAWIDSATGNSDSPCYQVPSDSAWHTYRFSPLSLLNFTHTAVWRFCDRGVRTWTAVPLAGGGGGGW